MLRTRIGRIGVAAIAGGALVIGLTASAASAQDAQAIYAKNCTMCHGVAGKGDGPAGKALKPPPGDFKTSLAGKSDADLTALIKDGSKVEGKKHAAFGGKVADDQIAGLVKYIKELAAK